MIKCRFRDDSQFYKLFHIYKWALDNKEDRITWAIKIEFIDTNKKKMGRGIYMANPSTF